MVANGNAHLNSNILNETMNPPLRNARVEIENEGKKVREGFHDNVDILFSIVGGQKPPKLPLREERQSHGIECIYDAKGIGHAVVSKEKKRKEAILMEKLNRVERKLEKKRSFRRTKKRKRALAMIKELKYQLENSASGISYKMYLDELRRVKKTMKNTDVNDDCSQESNSTVNSTNVERKVMTALDSLLNDPDFHLAGGEEDNNTIDESLLSIDSSHTGKSSTNEKDSLLCYPDGVLRHPEGETRQQDEEGEENDTTNDDRWNNVSIDAMSLSGKTCNSGKTTITSYTSKTHQASNKSHATLLKKEQKPSPVVKSPSSSSVRFKDVKLTTDDNLAHARALLNSARDLKTSFSYESTSNTISNSPSHVESVAPPLVAGPTKEIEFFNENERYHIFASYDEWSHCTLLVRALKRLQDIVSVSFVDCKWDPVLPKWEPMDPKSAPMDVSFWSISDKQSNNDVTFKDFKINHLDNLESTSDVVRIPILWDKKEKVVVSGKTTEIMSILNKDFQKWSKRPKLNLFPAGLKEDMTEIKHWLYNNLLLGVYRCGLATSQEQYDESNHRVTTVLDKANVILEKRGFLAGQQLTFLDVWLFVILFRFDEAYRALFKINNRTIYQMPGLMDFVKDIYHVKGIKEVCLMDEIKKQCFLLGSMRRFIVPRGGTFMQIVETTNTD